MEDFVIGGQGMGDVGSILMANNFDPNALRPWQHTDGRTFITMNNKQTGFKAKHYQVMSPTHNGIGLTQNAAATLRYDEWKHLDTAILKVAKERLNVVSDFRSAGLQYIMPNGMGHTVLQTENQSDITEAEITMDAVSRTVADRPIFDIVNLPLPIIHKDFHFTLRQLQTSRNSGAPLDTATAELAARRVAEKAERYLIGRESAYTYGGGTVYGFINYPSRLTKTLTVPDGTNNKTVLLEVLQMIDQARQKNHYGPFMLYCSPNWDPYMENDYSDQYPGLTLRERIKKTSSIRDVKTADYLNTSESTWQLVLVQMSSDVARVVVGMEIVTVQWDSHGGMMKNFKVMAIMVPQLRADQSSQTGIVHGSGT